MSSRRSSNYAVTTEEERAIKRATATHVLATIRAAYNDNRPELAPVLTETRDVGAINCVALHFDPGHRESPPWAISVIDAPRTYRHTMTDVRVRVWTGGTQYRYYKVKGQGREATCNLGKLVGTLTDVVKSTADHHEAKRQEDAKAERECARRDLVIEMLRTRIDWHINATEGMNDFDAYHLHGRKDSTYTGKRIDFSQTGIVLRVVFREDRKTQIIDMEVRIDGSWRHLHDTRVDPATALKYLTSFVHEMQACHSMIAAREQEA